jgi:hypothetical protein
MRLTRWMIEHGNCDRDRFLSQLEAARVCSQCTCGCASIDFQIGDHPINSKSGLQILGDFIYGDEQACLFGAFVFAQDDWLAGLEVYSMSGEIPTVLPAPESLRPWDGRTEPSNRANTASPHRLL